MNAQPPDQPDAEEPSLRPPGTTLWHYGPPLPRSGTAAETPEEQGTVSLGRIRSDEEPTVRKDSTRSEQAIPTQLAHYEIVAEIARGGMGVVYEARDRKLDRLVALKVMRMSLLETDEGLLRFQREARAAARLNHPHIVPVHDFGREGNFLFYTMALIDGRTLSSCRDRYARDMRAAVDLVRKTALAVAYAHDHGVLHRDLKPSNILVDAAGEPRVADFGLAKFFAHSNPSNEVNGRTSAPPDHPEVSQAGQAVGTPAYMALEQFKGGSKQLGPACDIWALGVILYELLGGVRPFRGATTPAVRNAVLHEKPRGLRKLNPRVDPGLEAVVMKCLEKHPQDRFASARELAAELERWLNDQPLQTKPRKWTDRVRRYVRRNWAPLNLGIVILLTGCLAVAGIPFVQVPSEDIRLNQEAFDLQGEVQLVGPVGPPKAYTVVRGDAGVVIKSDMPFSVHSLYRSLVELLPGPMPESFLFEAELQQANANFMGTFGLYLGRIEPNHPGCDWFLRFSLADIKNSAAILTSVDGSRGNWLRLDRVYCVPRLDNQAITAPHSLSLRHHWHAPADPWSDQGPWRKMAVEVRNDHLFFRFDGLPCLDISKEELQNRSRESAGLQGEKHPPLLWPTLGGLGVYAERCSVRIRNVRVQRLNP
jgi:serine/threonine protein kinase